jgi:bromodomain-containing factor 1
MQDDDEATPPPAKRARKYSDADQASIANVSTSVIVRLDRHANSVCLLSYLPSANLKTGSPPPVTASSI